MKTISNTTMLTTPEYRQFIEDLKARVTAARISAARAVNRDLILLYWDIGRGIVEKQRMLGWGESVVEMVSATWRDFPRWCFSTQCMGHDLILHTRTSNLATACRQIAGMDENG
jgi:hypothetical protein